MRGKKDDLEMLHQYNIYPSKRFVTLFEEINADTVRQTCHNVLALDLSDGPITIYLNTPGGSWYDGMALYDVIKNCKNHVTVIGLGHVMSMGPIIMQAADERQVHKNCRMLLHYGYDGFEGNSEDLVQAGKEAKYLQDRMVEVLLARYREAKPGGKRQAIVNLLPKDRYMSPEEFVKYGLADKVVGDE